MERFYTKTVMSILCVLYMSCAFDPKEPKRYSLGNDYYASMDVNSPDDGVIIEYSENEEFFTIIASHCLEIYKDSTKILYSTNYFTGDTTNKDYYVIDIISKNKPEKLNIESFTNQIKGLKQIPH